MDSSRGPGRRKRLITIAGGVLATAALLAPSSPALAAAALAAGHVTTVAGGYGGPGLATKVALSAACGVAADSSATYLDDGALRSLSPATGQLANLAAAPHEEGMCHPAVDAVGNVLFAQQDQVLVWARHTGTYYGQPMTAGQTYVIVPSGDVLSPDALAVDQAGNVLIADVDQYQVFVLAEQTGRFYGQQLTAGRLQSIAGGAPYPHEGNGGPATQANLDGPFGLTVDPAGNLILAEANDQLRVVAGTSGTWYGRSMVAGHIYLIAGRPGASGFSGDGGPASAARLNDPLGVSHDAAGNLLVADTGNGRIRVIAARTGTFYGQAMTTGDIYTVAGDGSHVSSGDGGPALAAGLTSPGAVTADTDGNLVVATGPRLRVVAASTGSFYGQAMAAGDIYTVAGDGQDQSGVGGLAVRARLAYPYLTATAPDGSLAIVNGAQVLLVPAVTGAAFGLALTARHIYDVAGDGTQGFSGDGGPGPAAELNQPAGLAFDPAGNLVISDTGNRRLQVVAARTGTFYGQAMQAGDIYTVVGNGGDDDLGDGGPALTAGIYLPATIAAAFGDIAIVDTGEATVRLISARTGSFYGQAMTAGDIYTVAGDGSIHFNGDGGLATSAGMYPTGVAFAPGGDVLIADSYANQRIRKVAR